MKNKDDIVETVSLLLLIGLTGYSIYWILNNKAQAAEPRLTVFGVRG